MTFEESQDYIAKRGFDIPWNDCDVFVDEREIVRTVGNVLKWADTTMLNKACEWLKENIWVYINYEGCSGEELENDVIEDFRKAMQNE